MSETKIESPISKAWKRLKKNYPAMVSMLIISVAVFLAVTASMIAPDKTPNGNDQVWELAFENPGFKTEMLKVRRNRPIRKASLLSKLFAGKDNPYELVPINSYQFDGNSIVVERYQGKEYAAKTERFDLANVLYHVSLEDTTTLNGNELVLKKADGTVINRSLDEVHQEIESENIFTKTYKIGTDKLGRDILSRLLYGLRVSLSVGFIAVVISLVIGIVVGATAGFYRNDSLLVSRASILAFFLTLIAWIATANMILSLNDFEYSRLVVRLLIFAVVGTYLLLRFIFKKIPALQHSFVLPYDDITMLGINVVWSIPTILLAMALSFSLGQWLKSFWVIYIAVGLSMWVEVARIVRGQVMVMREMEYVQAAKGLGFNNSRTIFLHILPNIIGPVMVIMAANFAAAILIEAGLSFIGIGVQPPQPSLGNMLSEYRNYLYGGGKAFLALAPGFCIMIMVLAFNLIGNGLRDAFDVKGK